jgi:hypothetical protein
MKTWNEVLTAAHNLSLSERRLLIRSLQGEIDREKAKQAKPAVVRSWKGLKAILAQVASEERPTIFEVRMGEEMNRRMAEHDKKPEKSFSADRLMAMLKKRKKIKIRKPLSYPVPAKWRKECAMTSVLKP